MGDWFQNFLEHAFRSNWMQKQEALWMSNMCKQAHKRGEDPQIRWKTVDSYIYTTVSPTIESVSLYYSLIVF